MSEKKETRKRPYPPDYCSTATLAYRLDCSESTIEQYAVRGLLPRPVMIGNLKRWRWSDVELLVAGENSVAVAFNSAVGDANANDAYEDGLGHGAA